MEDRTEQIKSKQNLLNLIFAKTFTRHSELDEEQFLKEIGFSNTNVKEDKAVRIAVFNVCMELANQFMKARETFTTAKNILKLHLIDNEELNKGDEN